MIKETNTQESVVSHEFNAFLNDFEDLIKQTSSLSGEDLAVAKEKISRYVNEAKKSINELTGDVSKRARRTATITNNYVHSNPWQVIGAGAAAGVIMGFLLSRRKS